MAAAKRKKRPRQSMPASVRRALVDEELLDAYKARPAYQRNDYLAWIKRAKTEATKQRRLDTMLRELRSGARYMNMVWRSPNTRRISAPRTVPAHRSTVQHISHSTAKRAITGRSTTKRTTTGRSTARRSTVPR